MLNVFLLVALTKKLTLLLKTRKLQTICRLLGVKIDSKLTANTHINDICKKAGQTLNTWQEQHHT